MLEMDILQRVLAIGQRAPLPLLLSFLITTIVGFALLVGGVWVKS